MSGTDARLGLVLIDGGHAGRRHDLIAQVGAVPQWFAPTDDPTEPHIAWVLGEGVGWPARAADALADGALAVVVDEPRLADMGSLTALKATDLPVLITSRWTHAPAVCALAAELAAVPQRPTFVEMLVVDDVEREPADALTGALLILAAAGLAVDRVEGLIVSPTLVTAEARAGEMYVHVSVVCAPDAQTRLKLAVFGSFGSLTVNASDPGIASPGEVLLASSEGARILPSDYRTELRIALGEARDAVVEGSRPVLSVADLEHAAHLAFRATPAGSPARRADTSIANAKEHI